MQLIKGDCLEVLKTIPEKSVDLILTDPPYGTTACKWDTIIPFAPMWEQLHRVIKDNGAIVLFGSEPFSSNLRLSNLDNYKYDWKYKKCNATGFLNAKKQPLRNIEDVLVFYKEQCIYFPQGLIYNPHYNISGGTENYNITKNENYTEWSNYPTQILEYTYDSDKYHPTQKPTKLLEYLILTYTQKGETVLDFTMGSGSTGVAAVNTQRDFIGIELDENYFNIATERIKNAQAQGVLDF